MRLDLILRRGLCIAALGHPLLAAALPGDSVRAVGKFSNMSIADEHCHGYTVELWRDSATMYGLFFDCDGLAGDTPVGRLEHVVFDSTNRRLTFEAKLSISSSVLRGGQQVPSHDRFRFSGTLESMALVGMLSHVNEVYRDSPPDTELVHLRRHRVRPTAYADSEQWTAMADHLLRLQGPRW